jgi:hypothetical protein
MRGFSDFCQFKEKPGRIYEIDPIRVAIQIPMQALRVVDIAGKRIATEGAAGAEIEVAG